MGKPVTVSVARESCREDSVKQLGLSANPPNAWCVQPSPSTGVHDESAACRGAQGDETRYIEEGGSRQTEFRAAMSVGKNISGSNARQLEETRPVFEPRRQKKVPLAPGVK